MAKKEKVVKSQLQQQADSLRELTTVIEQFEIIEADCKRDVEVLSSKLSEAQSCLADTQSLLTAQREKLLRDADTMYQLISNATESARFKSSHGCPY